MNSFKLLEAKTDLRRKSKRFPMSVLLFITGRCLLNVTAFLGLKRLALKKGYDSEFHVVLGVNEAAGTVALYVVAPNTPNSIKMRQLADGKVSVNLEDALDELPGLVTSSRVKCSVVETVDDKGEPCLVINLGSRLSQSKRPAPEAAEAAQPAEAVKKS